MNKGELVDVVSAKANVTKKDAGIVVTAVFDVIATSLEGKDRVVIPGFGTFSTKHAEARTGRNPSTGESLEIPARSSVKFKPAKELKERVA